MKKDISRKIKATRNIIFGYFNKFSLIILEFISRSFFIKILGEELLGVNGVFSNIIQLLSLAELGLNNVVSYSFYKPLAFNDTKKITSLIQLYKKIYNTIAITVFIIGLSIFPFISFFVKTELNIENIKLIYLIFLIDTVFSYLFVYKTILLIADQKSYINNSYIVISNIIRFVLQILSLITFKNIYIYLSIKVFINILCNFLLSKRTDKEFPSIKDKKDLCEISAEEKKSLLSIIKSGFIYKLSALLLNSTDNLLISILVGTIWVGYISNYDTIYSGIGSIYVILFTSLTPSIGNLVATETSEKKFSIFYSMGFIASWIAILFSTCFFTLADDFISIWIGKKYVLDFGSVISKSIIVFLSCSMQPVFSYREALGLYKKTKYVMLFSAILNIILSILFGNIYGIKGILLASIISMMSTYFWYEPYLLYKNFFFKKFIYYIIKKIYDIFILFLCYYFTYLIFRNWNVFTYLDWFLKGTSIFIFVNIICIISFSFFPEFKKIIKKFLTLIRSTNNEKCY